MHTQDTTTDIPSIVAEELRQAQIANIPAVDQPGYVADRIRQRIAGGAEYVRKRAASPAARANEIRRRFNGRNLDELAREYNLTVRRVRQIVSEF